MMRTVGAIATAFVIALALALPAPQAHKTVVSKFTYYQDVLPILEARCGRCHVDGGVAPTLLTYQAAVEYPWGIQQSLLSRRMPPWAADRGLAPLKGHEALTSMEFDTLMMWAAGGTPAGSPARPSRLTPPSSWALGEPDLVVAMPAGVTLPADQAQLDREVVIPLPPASGRWIRAVDLLPGAPAIVRRAEIVLRSRAADDQVVGLWVPGESPQFLEGGAAFRVPDQAALVLRMHYARPSKLPAAAITDVSHVGLYFTSASRALSVDVIVAGDDEPTPRASSRVIVLPIARAARLVAIRPISGPIDAMVRVVLTEGGTSRTPIARLQLRQEWPRRYVLQSPIALPAGSRIELTVTSSQGWVWDTLIDERAIGDREGGPLRIALETVR
jgi:hypothetical protein